MGDPECNDEVLEARVRAHLREWFDENGGKEAGVREGGGKGSVSVKMGDVAKWRHLRTYRVPYAQPAQTPPGADDGFYGRDVKVRCGKVWFAMTWKGGLLCVGLRYPCFACRPGQQNKPMALWFAICRAEQLQSCKSRR